MSRISRRASGAVPWLICITGIFALCWSAASHLYQADNPALALAINPLNTEARVNELAAALNREPRDLPVLQASAEQLIRQAPADARGYSLLGAVYEARGDAERAFGLYETALEHSKTEIHALLNLANRALGAGDAAKGLDYLDLILRRWREEVPQAFSIVGAASRDPEARPVLANKLGQLPPWRGAAIRELLKEPDGLSLVHELLTREGATAVRPRRAEINATVAALAGANAVRASQALFLATLPEERRDRAGYIYDGSFLAPASGEFFGWQATSNGASEVALPAAGGGLSIRFRDTPARLGNVAQRLALPAGLYRLSSETTATLLTTPKRLYWRVSCGDTGRTLSELVVPDRSYGRQTLATEFEVPNDGCTTQRLSIETDAKTDSWRDRYKGEVIFHALHVTRL